MRRNICSLRKISITVFIFVVIFTATLYVFGFVQLRRLYVPNETFISDNLFDDQMRQKVDKIFAKHAEMIEQGEKRGEKFGEQKDIKGSRDTIKHTKMAEMYQKHLRVIQRIDIHEHNFQKANEERKRAAESETPLPQKHRAETSTNSTPRNSNLSKVDEETTEYTLMYDETTEPMGNDEATRPSYVSKNSTSVIPANSATERARLINIPQQPVKKIQVSDLIIRTSNIEVLNPHQNEREFLREHVQNSYRERKARLRKFCGYRKGWMWLGSMQMLAVPERDVVVCTVQKAGSVSWHKLLHDLKFPDKQWNGDRKQDWKFASELLEKTKGRLMKSKKVTRVLTVRHPFARLVSVWNSMYHKSFVVSNGNKIFSSMPGLKDYIGRHQINKGYVIAFEDFVQYVADVGLNAVDDSLRSVDELCRPCLFPYDYIIKSETAPEDSWIVTERINSTLKDFLRHIPVVDESLGRKYDSTADARKEEEARIISRLFRKVPRATIRMLLQLYANDFKAFGYSFDVSTLETGG